MNPQTTQEIRRKPLIQGSSLQVCSDDALHSIRQSDRSGTAGQVHAEGISAKHDARIYRDLAEHQKAEPWHGQPMIELLQTWAERFVAEFNLDIPEVVIGIDTLPCTRYGQFRMGHNGLGLRGEIALNARYLDGKRPLWEILGTLLHELLHGWQQAHGTPSKKNHHNKELREKAAQLGLLIGPTGLTGYTAGGPFKALLGQFGVEAPATEAPIPERRPRGESKQKKWTCKCPVNVRCAVELQAQCLVCGEIFALSMDSHGRQHDENRQQTKAKGAA